MYIPDMKLFLLLVASAVMAFGQSDEMRIYQRQCSAFDLSSMSATKAVCVDVAIPTSDAITDHVVITVGYLFNGSLKSESRVVPRIGNAASALFGIKDGFQGVQAITAVCQTLSGKSTTTTYR